MMTSTMRKRCATLLVAIGAMTLVGLIILVWTQFGTNRIIERENKMVNVNRKDYIKHSHLDSNSDVEYVKPIKMNPPPLHDQDIIFARLHNNNGVTTSDHHSGHFRHRHAELWDSHPRYELNAFGDQMILNLRHADSFVSPGLHVIQQSTNHSQRIRHDPRLSKCYYTGNVDGVIDSDVSVSLCNGMTGYIRTPSVNYHIEPAEKVTTETTIGTLLHRITKNPIRPSLTDNNESIIFDTIDDQCEINEDHTIITDDFIDTTNKKRKKRHISFDEIDTEEIENNTQFSYEIYRTPRDTNWAKDENFLNEPNLKNHEHHIKVLIVIDKTVVTHHQNDADLNHYVLTLMSHVALLYKDATIGNAISVSVVKIWILKDYDFQSPNSQEMLTKFCRWQKDNITPRLHDVAILFTRSAICRNISQACTTLGVAEVGSMCNPLYSCAIVKDMGLATSYTIAHELGHVLGMPHDDDKKCLALHRGLKENRIMSRMIQNDTKPWLWSECSRHYVTEFLDSGRARCLLNAPTTDYITTQFMQSLPGETFEADVQCELENGIGSKICSFMPSCDKLWCSSGEQLGCQSQWMPWAEGTRCGTHKWCHRGQCVDMNRESFKPIAGGWGKWQTWSTCSRTCGGGITTSKRVCDKPIPKNGGAFCIGRSVRYASCNTQSCERDLPDFREIQCGTFNGITKNLPNLTNDVEWVPKYGLQSEQRCKLYCRPKNSNAYYLLKDKVIDGTKCEPYGFDICVNGLCRPAGCDNQLDSKMELDECGICGGNNSHCQEVVGKYNGSSYGYTTFLTIPKGSSNLDIKQISQQPDKNYLVLLDGDTKKFILNGQNVVANIKKDILFGTLLISYSGANMNIERITTPKNQKLDKDLIVGILSIGDLRQPNITYRYIVNQENSPRYGWTLYQKEWTKCSAICGGYQQINPICTDLITNREKPDSFCSNLNRPIQQRECNTDCELMWVVASHEPCSTNCGLGTRQIYYNCMRIDVDDRRMVMNEEHCDHLVKPPEIESCEGSYCRTTRWEYGDWSACSKSCGGGGIQRRTATCVDREGHTVADSHCTNIEPVLEQICTREKCPVWLAGEWTSCSVTCGRGFRTRPFYCHVDGRIYDKSSCNPDQRGIDREECMEMPCAHWSVGDWSDCSTTCGDGRQTREVICKLLNDETMMEERFCGNTLKPDKIRRCTLSDCPTRLINNDNNDIIDNILTNEQYQWITGAWSQCTKRCGSGTTSRMVICRDNYGLESNRCNPSQRPLSITHCNTHTCPQWTYGAWSRCDGNCEKHRRVLCQNATGSILSESDCDRQMAPPMTTKCRLDQCTEFTHDEQKRHYFHDKQERFRWKVGRWGECSNTCGKGIRRRSVNCEDSLNNIEFVDQYCAHVKRPESKKACKKYQCAYTWYEDYWSACSATCGHGYKTRNVTCHKVHQGGFIDPQPLPNLSTNKLHHKKYCDVYNKPATKASCMKSRCEDEHIWYTGPWKECTHLCGRKGRQTRQVYCIHKHTHHRLQKHHCPKDLKPNRKRPCNQWPCPYRTCKDIQHFMKTKSNRNYLIDINGKLVTIYCYKMDTNEPTEYISLNGDNTNYAQFYHRRSKNPRDCPYDCDTCIESIEPDRGGTTVFWKIRLNVTTLRVDINDFTFARHLNGAHIAYGTAGDCFSEVEDCTRGQFSIDLTGTNFRVNSLVEWRNIGNLASSRIDNSLSNQRITGRCGGYCGTCVPDPSMGLVIEVT